MAKVTRDLLLKWGFRKPTIMHVTPIGRDHYKVDSETREEIAHVVDLEGKRPECSCENHTIDKNPRCKHIRRIGMLIEAELLPAPKNKIDLKPEPDQNTQS